MIDGSCSTRGTYPTCVSSGVHFQGTGYPSKVRVLVTDDSGNLFDDSVYDTTNGVLDFNEGLDAVDSNVVYTVVIKHGGNLNGGTILDTETVTITPNI